MQQKLQGNAMDFLFCTAETSIAAAEKDQFDQTRLIMGIHPENFEFLLKEGETFWAPEVMMVYSADGFEKMFQLLSQGSQRACLQGKIQT